VHAHAVDRDLVRAPGVHDRASVFVVLHAASDDGVPVPDEVWGLDFARHDGTGGFVRLTRGGDRCWYWAYLVGPHLGLVVVRDHDVDPPRRPDTPEVRAEGLWAELVCETPDEHWGIALEAFGVALDDPSDAIVGSDEAEIGLRVPVGLDLEWEVGDHPPDAGRAYGTVHGEILLGRERVSFDGSGVLRRASREPWPTVWAGAWCTGSGRWCTPATVVTETGAAGLAVPHRVAIAATEGRRAAAPVVTASIVPVPLVRRPGPVLVRALTLLGSRGSQDDEPGTGWIEVLQSTPSTVADPEERR
jgi:hypothetical protein